MRSNYSNLAKTYTTDITSAAIVQNTYNKAILYNITGDYTTTAQCSRWNLDNDGSKLTYSTENGDQQLTCENVSGTDGVLQAVLSCTKDNIGVDCCPGTEKDDLPAYIYKKDPNNAYFCSTSGSAPLPPQPRKIPTGNVIGWCDQINHGSLRPGIDECISTCPNAISNYKDCGGLQTIKVNAKRDLDRTCWQSTRQDPAWLDYCGQPVPSDAFNDPITNPNASYGCQSTLPGQGTIVSSSDLESIRTYCYYNDNCKGYYSNGYSWGVATDIAPGECHDISGVGGYNKYVQKKYGNPPS